MTFVTYLPRLIPLLGRSEAMPEGVRRFLSYVPAAVFAALVFPGVLLTDGAVDIAVSNPQIAAGIATVAICVWRKNLALAVLGGIVTFAIWLALFV